MHIPHKIIQKKQWQLVPLAGPSIADVQQKSAALTRYIQQHPHVSLDQIASLLSQADAESKFRKAVVVNSSARLTEQLAVNEIKKIASNTLSKQSRVVFMFPGIGDHYVQMGRGLYEEIPYFREIIDQCDAALRPYLTHSFLNLLYPSQPTNQPEEPAGLDLAAMLGRKPLSSTSSDSPEAQLQKTAVAHPLVFSIEYAMAKLLQHWGIQPQALIGYSLGEYVAATIAGVLTLENALMLVARRAQLIQALPAGKMLATPLSKNEVTPYLSKNVSLSAHSGEALTILAGEEEAILAVQRQLLDQQLACRMLDTTHAFHSHMMEGAVAELTNLAQSITYSAPQIPYLSNVTGTWITAKQAIDPTYWAQHMCQPVQYFTMLQNLLGKEQDYHLIEVGPGQSLGAFAKQHPNCKQALYSSIYPTVRYSYDHQDDHWFLLSTIRKLWLSGVDLQWEAVLPGYVDGDLEQLEHPLVFTPSQEKVVQPTQQKERGKRRRQNRLLRRGSSR